MSAEIVILEGRRVDCPFNDIMYRYFMAQADSAAITESTSQRWKGAQNIVDLDFGCHIIEVLKRGTIEHVWLGIIISGKVSIHGIIGFGARHHRARRR